MKLNLGCGERHFGADWVNVDVLYRPPNVVPDIVCDLKALSIAYDSADMIHLGHCIEHFGLGECNALLRELHRILKPGGSLIVTVPDIRALAKRWLTGTLDTYTMMVNVYGPYAGHETDRHRWGYDYDSLRLTILEAGFFNVRAFDWRAIEGLDCPRDFWILGIEGVK